MNCPTCGTEMEECKVMGRNDIKAYICPKDPTHWEVMPVAVVAPAKWNKLSKGTKCARVGQFHAHITELVTKYPQAPIDLSYLKSLAIRYQTPVPALTQNCEVDWGEYR